MKKIAKFSLTVLLVVSSFVTNPVLNFATTIEADTKSEVSTDAVYYNDFDETTGNWIDYKSKMTRTVDNGKMKIRNTGESIILNNDDSERDSGDIEMTFDHKLGNRCFGLVFRANENVDTNWQVVAYVEGQNGTSPEWSIGQPGGKWNSYPAQKLVANQKYRMLVRYHETNVTVYLNGEEVLNEEIVYAEGKGSIDGDWVGRVGVRKHCVDQDFEFERFVSGPLGSIPVTGFPDMTEDLYYNNFEKDSHGFKNYKGTTSMSVSDGKLNLSNQQQEGIILNEADKMRSEGAIEVDFTHSNGMRCMGPIFRADATNANTGWQTVAYEENGEGIPSWSVGQPGGKWNRYPKASKLEAGKEYKLVVKYQGDNIKVYLNGELQLDETIVYSDGTSINGDWSGQTGIRKYCLSQAYSINRFVSADYDAIPNEGFVDMIIPSSEYVEPEEPGESEANLAYYKAMRDMWRDQKTGGFTNEDLQDAYVQNYITNLNEDASILYAEVSFGTSGVWNRKSSDTHSATITTQFEKLNTVVKAYKTFGSDFYEDPEVYDFIVRALEYLTGDKWFDGKKVTGNWWNFSVGIPQEFADILIILSETLPKQEVKRYAQILSNYVPNAERQISGAAEGNYINISFASTATGANRTDLALSYLASGILLEKETIVSDVAPSIESVIRIVKSGDGFYEDGSYVQHGDIPYTGSYGNVAIKGVGKILTILEGSPWQMSDAKIDTFSKLVNDSFIPIIYKGETMPMVGGRSISRAPGSRKKGFGSATVFNLLIVSNFASEPYKTKLKETAKYWILQDNTEYYYNNNRDLRDLIEVKRVLNDTSISGTTLPFNGSKLFGSMDRFVHTNENYSLGLSMYSRRISAYEAGNGENKRGWFTSDGMIYLQNGDSSFGETYWPTIDFRRLPGTTVDLRPLVDETSGFSKQRSSESFVGGSTDGDNASIVMTLNKTGFKNSGKEIGLDLKAHKSWFFTEDAIFALGSDIQGTSPIGIETIVENRLLDEKMNYVFKTNTEAIANDNINVNKGDWFMLEADDSANNIAYVFLDHHKIRLDQELRTGKYQDINSSFVNDKEYQETYQKIIIEHGKQVVDGTYAYVILPGITQEELEQFLSSDYEIIENSKDVQAIRKGEVVLGNVYNSNGGSIGDLSVNAPASFTVVESSKTISVNVSNPSHTDKKLQVKFDRDYLELQGSEGMTTAQYVAFEVETKGSAGKSHEVIITKRTDKSDLKSLVTLLDDLNRASMTHYYQERYDQVKLEVESMIQDETAEQETVDIFVGNTKKFMSDIQYILNLSNAIHTLDYVKILIESDYTSASWSLMYEHKLELEEMIVQYDETKILEYNQVDLDTLTFKLQDDINNLVLAELVSPTPSIDTEILESLISLFQELDEVDYTGVSYQTALGTVEEALLLLSTSDYSQVSIDALAERLLLALNALVEIEGALDLSQIKALITQYENLDGNQYTEASFDALSLKIDHARQLIKQNDTSQAEINDAVSALNKAFHELKERAKSEEIDLTQLKQLLERFDKLNSSLYTKASYTSLNNKINEAREIVNSDDTTQKTVDTIIKEIDALFDQLVTRAGGQLPGEDKPFNQNTLPNSGVGASDITLIGAALILLGIVLHRKRHFRR